jgi:hypothetical protein
VIVQPTGRLAPGVSIGVLTISNVLTLSGTTIMELNATAGTNDLVRGIGTVNFGGTLSLSNLGGPVSSTSAFRLFSANTYRGAFTALVPASPGPGLAWNTNTLAADGTLRVVSTAPVTLANSRAGGTLTLAWPSDHIGWRLQSQSNSISAGLQTNWIDVPTSVFTNEMTFNIEAAGGCVFYRLVHR